MKRPMELDKTMRLLPVFLCLVSAAWAQSLPAGSPGSPAKGKRSAPSTTQKALVKKAPVAPVANNLQAVVVTDLGTIRFELASDKAPKHVAAFVARVKEGYYDGSAFYRVNTNIIQGGDPGLKNPATPREQWGKGGRDIKLASERSDLKHVRGVVSAVRQYDPNTDGPQFFVCLSDLPALDKTFTTFGRVLEGMDVVDKISQVPVDETHFAKDPIRIVSITIEEKTAPSVSSEPNKTRAASEKPKAR